jgi:hypothetical protein
MDHDLTIMLYGAISEFSSVQPFDPDPKKSITGIVKEKW